MESFTKAKETTQGTVIAVVSLPELENEKAGITITSASYPENSDDKLAMQGMHLKRESALTLRDILLEWEPV
jgi:hypothetical protein